MFCPESGINLWREKKGVYSFNTPANFGMSMSYTRFKKIHTFLTCFTDENFKELDEWWHIIGGINMFNERRKENFQHIPVVCLDMFHYRISGTFGNLTWKGRYGTSRV